MHLAALAGGAKALPRPPSRYKGRAGEGKEENGWN